MGSHEKVMRNLNEKAKIKSRENSYKVERKSLKGGPPKVMRKF